MLSCGLDVGSLWTKAAVLKDGALVGGEVAPTGADTRRGAERALERALAAAGLDGAALPPLVVTGVGRKEVSLPGQQVTDVICLARGARLLRPAVRCVIDVGGESTRVVRLDERGDVVDFTLNDKCAAGTGVFLDAMAKVMGVPTEELGPLSLQSTAEINITSICVAFAESEVVSLVHRQTPRRDILRGLHRSIAARVYGMARRGELEGELLLAGGLARNVGIARELEALLGRPLTVPAEAQLVAALGAAEVAAGHAPTLLKESPRGESVAPPDCSGCGGPA